MLTKGSIVRYQANVSAGDNYVPDWDSGLSMPAVEQAIRGAAAGKGANVVGYSGTQSSANEGNIQANIQTYIDRGSINDLKYDLDSAIQGLGVTVRGSAVQLTSPGGQVPGTIPAPIQGDNYHSGDTVLGTATSFWLDQIGQQVQGVFKSVSAGGPALWIGVGVVALLIFGNRR